MKRKPIAPPERQAGRNSSSGDQRPRDKKPAAGWSEPNPGRAFDKLATSPRLSWTRHGFRALLLVVVTFLAYLPALHGGFLWDDDMHISSNETLRSWHGLVEIWFQPGATFQYYPLSFTLFWLGYHLWGLHPLGYHLLNVALHSLVALLLWQLLERLKVRGAWLAGMIFALHPVCVMSVAWMTELKNTLSAALALGAGWAYLRFARLGIYGRAESPDGNPEPGVSGIDWRYGVLSLALFVLAMFAKTAVSFLPATLLLDQHANGDADQHEHSGPDAISDRALLDAEAHGTGERARASRAPEHRDEHAHDLLPPRARHVR